MSVIDFCNRLIGPDQVMRINEDAIYALLMGCYLHDVGMGISMRQYEEFSQKLPVEEYLAIVSRHQDWAPVSEEKRGAYLRDYTALSEFLRQGGVSG